MATATNHVLAAGGRYSEVLNATDSRNIAHNPHKLVGKERQRWTNHGQQINAAKITGSDLLDSECDGTKDATNWLSQVVASFFSYSWLPHEHGYLILFMGT
jgi:hypothetical protein